MDLCATWSVYSGFFALKSDCQWVLPSAIIVIVSTPPNISLSLFNYPPVILILHTIAFLSYSFTFWEDRIVSFALVSSIVQVSYMLVDMSASNKRLRHRILGFSSLFAVCGRLISISTIYGFR